MDNSPFSFQAQSGAYGIKNHEIYEDQSVPLSPNFLLLKDPALKKEKFEALYISSLDKSPSKEFILQLVCFSGLLWLSLLVQLIGRFLVFSEDNMSISLLIVHVVSITSLFIFSLFSVLSILRSGRLFRLNQFILTMKTAFVITYLLVTDDALHSDSIFTNSLLLVYFILTSLASVLFYSFFHMFWISLYAIIAFACTYAFASSSSTVWVNLLFLIIALLKLLSDCYILTYRTNQLLYRHHKETVAERNKDEEEDTHYESDLGKMLKYCTSVAKTLKFLRNIMLDLGIKSEINESLAQIRHISRILPIKLKFSMNLDDHKDMDEDDKLFICQNFIEEKTQHENSDKSSLTSNINTAKFMQDLNSDEVVHGIIKKFGKDWSFDTLFLSKVTPNSIQAVGKYFSEMFDVSKVLNIHSPILTNFFEEVNNGYYSNPYHNSAHACDVAHSVVFMVLRSRISEKMSMVDLYSMFVAALAHDIGHKGVNNRYLVNAMDDLAVMYNDLSIQENMHCWLLFKILKLHSCNIFSGMSSSDYRNIRKMIIEMILSTDMSKHFEKFGAFKVRTEVSKDLDIENYADKMLVFSIILKCADIGHTAKPLELHQVWTFRVVEEFFNQGDLEKENGLPISMYCDRNTTDLAKSQYGFLKNIAFPLFKVLSGYLNSSSFDEVCVKQLKANKQFWKVGGGNRRNTLFYKIDTSPNNKAEVRKTHLHDVYKAHTKSNEISFHNRKTI